MDTKTYLEPARELPVTEQADVLVAGTGPAGFATAVCAQGGVTPRHLDVAWVQQVLREQGVFPQ